MFVKLKKIIEDGWEFKPVFGENRITGLMPIHCKTPAQTSCTLDEDPYYYCDICGIKTTMSISREDYDKLKFIYQVKNV